MRERISRSDPRDGLDLDQELGKVERLHPDQCRCGRHQASLGGLPDSSEELAQLRVVQAHGGAGPLDDMLPARSGCLQQ